MTRDFMERALRLAERGRGRTSPNPMVGAVLVKDGEIERRYPEALAAWVADPLNTAPYGGESLGQVSARVRAALDAIARVHEGQTVVVVAHGGSLQVLLCLALGLVPKARWQFRLSAASLSELHQYDEGAVLTCLSDCSHLVAPFPGYLDVAPC